MRARLIVNPLSGTDRAPTLLPLINARLRTLIEDVDVTVTTGPEDAARAAARAVEERYDALYVAGGDGTLNMALRGVLASGRGPCTMPIGIIPLGTGNDFAKALGLGEQPEAALDALLDARVIDVDVGTVNDRPFVNTSAGGFVADVTQVVTEGLKDVTGKLAFLIGGARALWGSEPFSARVTLPGSGRGNDQAGAGPWAGEVELQMFAVCNARFIGGGYPIAPSALIDDGLLDVFLVKRMPLLEFIRVLQAIAAGEHLHDERVQHFRAAAFDLEFDRVVRVNTDGELLQADACRYRVRPRWLRFFCGAKPFATSAPREISGRV
jgi:diacylglycerol kinase (ATP)